MRRKRLLNQLRLPSNAPIHDTERVEGHCTCSAKLAEDARFCHRCGRPVRDDDPLLLPPEPEETETAETEPTTAERPTVQLESNPPQLATDPPVIEVNFRSALAVRVGFLAASIVQLTILLIQATHTVILLPVVLAAGGAFAVLLFCRRSGRILSVTEGARMGWIAGVFTFVITMVLLAASLLFTGKGFGDLVRETLKAPHFDPAAAKQLIEAIQDPQTLVFVAVLGLLVQFLFCAVASSLGGALGARLTRRG